MSWFKEETELGLINTILQDTKDKVRDTQNLMKSMLNELKINNIYNNFTHGTKVKSEDIERGNNEN